MQERGTRDAPPQSNFFHFHAVFGKYLAKQECNPLGCAPSAAVAVRVCGGESQHALGRRVCLSKGCLPRGVSALVGCLLGGVCSRGGCLLGAGVGVVSAQCMLGYTPHPPVNRMIDACENITFPQLRYRR